MISEMTMSFDLDTKRLARIFFTKDAVGAVIQAHLEVEASMEHVIKFFADATRDKREMPKMFGPKIGRLREFKIPHTRLAGLEAMNDLRKRFAHEGQHELTNENISHLERVTEVMCGGRKFDGFTVNLSEKAKGRTTSLQYNFMSNIEKLGFLSSLIATVVASTVEETIIRTAIFTLNPRLRKG